VEKFKKIIEFMWKQKKSPLTPLAARLAEADSLKGGD
jgi:hypothetical protein